MKLEWILKIDSGPPLIGTLGFRKITGTYEYGDYDWLEFNEYNVATNFTKVLENLMKVADEVTEEKQ